MGAGRHRRLHSTTPEYDLEGFEFFMIILENSSKKQTLPDTFMEMLHGHRPKNFVRAYDLRHGYFLVFRYNGDAMLTMKVFNTTMCRMRYQDDDDASNRSSGSDSGYRKSSSESGYSESSSEDDPE
nr:B3 domain-containing protein Os03g0212300-like [Aegilops tauschii subsp. strangulata]